jgi:AcrR family transcriptional regulator
MAERRTRQPRERHNGHPTRQLIVEAAATILKNAGVARFHVDDVLAATGLTRGAVYHHFHNVDDLVESALLATFVEGIQANLANVRNVMSSASSFDEFRSGILQANVLYATNEGLRAVRTLRAHALATAGSGERMATALAQQQQRLTDAYIDVITEAQHKGWVRAHLSPETLAVFIQAYSFGVILDDVSERHIEPASWADLIADFFDNCVFTGRNPVDGHR